VSHPPSFESLPLLGQAHLQTLLGAFVKPWKDPPSIERRVVLPDGDRLSLLVSTPVAWTDQDPTAVLVHGLTGSDQSAYMVRLAHKYYNRGVRAVRLNLRGAGTGVGIARKPYNGGCSDDVWCAIEELHAETPRSAFTLAGFSLGGNIVLKLAGEKGDDARRLLRQVIAFCPPVDLHAASRKVSRRRNVLLERFFVGQLKRDADLKAQQFPDLEHPETPRTWSLFEFDDGYTAPIWGYENADAYYQHASAKYVMGQIRVPCRVTLAQNDPIIELTSLDDVELPPCVQLLKADGGGHLGFLAPRRAGGLHWLDNQVLAWTAS
jgi:uncharacterized protein